MLFCDNHHIPVDSFCDNDVALHGKKKMGFRIISPKDLKEELNKMNGMVIVSMKEGNELVREQLINLKIDTDRIVNEIPEGIL